jgi:RNA polymerase sigma factor (sigma-70 family)
MREYLSMPRNKGNGRDFIWNLLDKYPPLSREKTHEYVSRMSQGDTEARNLLVLHNLRLVADIAGYYLSNTKGFDFEELFQAGAEKVIRTIGMYREDGGASLGTYLRFPIGQAISVYIWDNSSLVFGRRMMDMMNNFKKAVKSYEGELPDDPEALSEITGMGPRLIKNILNAKRAGTVPIEELMPVLRDEANSPETDAFILDPDELNGMVTELVSSLSDDQERHILESRLCENPRTLQELGDEYGFTREWARLKESSGIRKIRESLESDPRLKTVRRRLRDHYEARLSI